MQGCSGALGAAPGSRGRRRQGPGMARLRGVFIGLWLLTSATLTAGCGGSAPAETEPGETRPAETAEADSIEFSGVIPAFREQVSKYGSDRVAVPIGGTALVLVYNRRAFDREENQAAAREAGVALAPPATWND